MGGKWSICARNLKDDCWKVSDYSCNFIQFIFKGIFCLIKYDVVELGIHGGLK